MLTDSVGRAPESPHRDRGCRPTPSGGPRNHFTEIGGCRTPPSGRAPNHLTEIGECRPPSSESSLNGRPLAKAAKDKGAAKYDGRPRSIQSRRSSLTTWPPTSPADKRAPGILISSFRKDTNICMTADKERHHAYFPALITCIAFSDFLSGLHAGNIKSHSLPELKD